ncbi:SufE family protein [Tepidicaulis sp.]|jgi:cysteine desulfuration protein SufE|uniref:SufE family protein n=1 Tax=Tepidicaulis sp. TaxID=1920809 RepID=UPI003B58BEF9
MSIESLLEDFAFLDDWEDRYRYVIELGKGLAPLSEAEHNSETKVQGCVSQVWLVSEVAEEQGKITVLFRGDSDAHIVKGLIAILLEMYSGKSPEEILAIDAKEVFSKLGLDEHLSPQRSNGLYSMVNRARADATAAIAGAQPA